MNKTYNINYNHSGGNELPKFISGPISFYHFKKEGEKNIYLFGDHHASFENICDFSESKFYKFHIFVEKLIKKYPDIEFDIGLEEPKKQTKFVNGPLTETINYFRERKYMIEKQKGDKYKEKKNARFHYMDIRRQEKWDNNYIFNIIGFFGNYHWHMPFHKVINLDKIIEIYNITISPNKKFFIMDLLLIIVNKFKEDKLDIYDLSKDKFINEIGLDAIKDAIKKSYLEEIISIDKLYDILFKKPYLYITLFYNKNIIDYDFFKSYALKEYAHYVFLFQNNSVIVNNFISKINSFVIDDNKIHRKNRTKIQILKCNKLSDDKIKDYIYSDTSFLEKRIEYKILKDKEKFSYLDDNKVTHVELCSNDYEMKGNICTVSTLSKKDKLYNTLFLIIKTTDFYKKFDSYNDFLYKDQINEYIKYRILKLIDDKYTESNDLDFHDLEMLNNDIIFDVPENINYYNKFLYYIHIKMSVLFMDIYSIIRIMKKYTKNIILYFGDTHIKNIRDFFLKNGYSEVYSNDKQNLNDKQPNRCIDIGDSFDSSQFIK